MAGKTNAERFHEILAEQSAILDQLSAEAAVTYQMQCSAARDWYHGAVKQVAAPDVQGYRVVTERFHAMIGQALDRRDSDVEVALATYRAIVGEARQQLLGPLPHLHAVKDG